MIKPGRGVLELFQGQQASPWPPNCTPFLLLPPPPPRQGRGRGLVGAPKPWPLSTFLPEKEEGQCPEPTAASASRASRATGGLCDPLSAAVPWRQRSADRRPHDSSTGAGPALPGSGPGARRPGLARAPAAGLDVVLCRPGGLLPVPVSTLGGLPFLPSQALRDGRTPLSPWPGESCEPSAC